MKEIEIVDDQSMPPEWEGNPPSASLGRPPSLPVTDEAEPSSERVVWTCEVCGRKTRPLPPELAQRYSEHHLCEHHNIPCPRCVERQEKQA